MELERAIRVLEIEKLYALRQTGLQQKPINKEVAEACDIAIEALKEKMKEGDDNG